MMSPSADTLRIIGSVTGVALVLGVVVSLITHALAPQKTGDMLIQLAATFIAALLALAVGVGLF